MCPDDRPRHEKTLGPVGLRVRADCARRAQSARVRDYEEVVTHATSLSRGCGWVKDVRFESRQLDAPRGSSADRQRGSRSRETSLHAVGGRMLCSRHGHRRGGPGGSPAASCWRFPAPPPSAGCPRSSAGERTAGPGTTAWKLGGNPDVATNGSNYLGTNNPGTDHLPETKPERHRPRHRADAGEHERQGRHRAWTSPGARLDVKTAHTRDRRARLEHQHHERLHGRARRCPPTPVSTATGATTESSAQRTRTGGTSSAAPARTRRGSGYGLYGDGNVGVYGMGELNRRVGLRLPTAKHQRTDGYGHIGIYARSSDYVGVSGATAPSSGVVGQSIASSGTSYAMFGDSRTATGGDRLRRGLRRKRARVRDVEQERRGRSGSITRSRPRRSGCRTRSSSRRT